MKQRILLFQGEEISSYFQIIFFSSLLILLTSCHTPRRLVSADYHRYEINQDSLSSSTGTEISLMITPYKSQVDQKMNTVIGTVPYPMKKERIESTLGNWLADAIAQYVNKKTGKKVDLAICNYGGIRIPVLAAGPLTIGDIYELMPFDNYVVTMNVTGKTMHQLLDRIARYGGWPVSSHLQLEVQNNQITRALLNDEPISPDSTYFIALSDYLANGGDGLDFLTELAHENLNVYYRDALIESAKEQKEITAVIEGRIIYKD